MKMDSNTPVRVVNCPNCGAPVEWRKESRYRPFCSERCKLFDIGAWASNSYSVPGQETPVLDDDSKELE